MSAELLDAWIVFPKHDFVKKVQFFEGFGDEKQSW
jgi:hypothetical protein